LSQCAEECVNKNGFSHQQRKQFHFPDLYLSNFRSIINNKDEIQVNLNTFDIYIAFVTNCWLNSIKTGEMIINEGCSCNRHDKFSRPDSRILGSLKNALSCERFISLEISVVDIIKAFVSSSTTAS
jgi:hypothetical protein